MNEFERVSPANNDVFKNDNYILKTGHFNILFKNNINQKCNFNDCKVLSEYILNMEIEAYLKLKKHPDMLPYFPKFIKKIKTKNIISKDITSSDFYKKNRPLFR